MSRIEDLLALRSADPRKYDVEVWAFMDRVEQEKLGGGPLRDASEAQLQTRLGEIERNIQYLDDGVSAYAALSHNDGWRSPWWWYRTRHLTLAELERRGVAAAPSAEIAVPPVLRPEFHGRYAGGRDLLVRVSRLTWLNELLDRGRLRFTPAANYANSSLNLARGDNEMAKAYTRPSGAVTITAADGSPIRALGEVTFSVQRKVEVRGTLVDRPYWMQSFSSDLDPRLMDAFSEGDSAAYGALVIFDAAGFMKRAHDKVSAAVPHADFIAMLNEYFDPYCPPTAGLNTLRDKRFEYAYQREVRLVLDPGAGAPLGTCLEVDIGPIVDLGGVYDQLGRKVAGAGPDTFFSA